MLTTLSLCVGHLVSINRLTEARSGAVARQAHEVAYLLFRFACNDLSATDVFRSKRGLSLAAVNPAPPIAARTHFNNVSGCIGFPEAVVTNSHCVVHWMLRRASV
ncbi:hypothetical protein [Caballeronia telluris]|uniref:Uncharacterized protein n=1 Tax=Caballeronia telluris TaxID=326475 RepID=A0A158KDS8_9BURK|nr:hypothetical protein [Caballeronia telluris]SAL79247.1 hypothetical protein AWB66_06010 [Caballeronia telluris]